MPIQQRNNNKNFPNVFISVHNDGTNVVAFCHNCKTYYDAAVGSGSGYLWNLFLHMIEDHGYVDDD